MQVVKRTDSLKRISFLAHSLGGLFARYAISELYSPAALSTDECDEVPASTNSKSKTASPSRRGLVAGLEPVNFITLATPHLGVRGKKQVRSCWFWLICIYGCCITAIYIGPICGLPTLFSLLDVLCSMWHASLYRQLHIFSLKFHSQLFKGFCRLLFAHMNFCKTFRSLSNSRPAFETIRMVLLERSCQLQTTFKLMNGFVSSKKHKST